MEPTGVEGGSGAADGRAAEGLAHLQAAAREMIAAARAMLDVAEGLVEDPAVVTAMVDTVGSVVRGAAQAAMRSGPRRSPGEGGDDDDPGGYERIRVG
ncbi:MAG: hypothetical protein H0W25_17325 [Acidimicrobiia bacterium]|nr:hypothetical protein [Acidimicrobiia bacterium]